MIGRYGQAETLRLAYSRLVLNRVEKQMKKYIILLSLALLTLVGAVLEGLVEDISPLLVQCIGGLTLLSGVALIVWALSYQTEKFK